MYDVLVIGGGPAGSRAAARLAGLGHRVAVVDRNPASGTPVCCTGIVSEECVASYSIDESVIYRHVHGAMVFPPAGQTVHLRRDAPQAAILNRPGFNALMASRAVTVGTEWLPDTRAIDFTHSPDHLEVICERRGKELQIAAKAVIIAGGFGQELNTRSGLKTISHIGAGAQTEVTTPGPHEVEVFLGSMFSRGYFAWLVPTSPGKALAGLLSDKAPRQRLEAFLGFLRAEGKITAADSPLLSSAVTLRPLQHAYAHRTLVVGTAAGQVKPITGGGIYFGLLCADLAADTLDRAIRRNDFSAESLSEYDRSWKALLGDELKYGYWARRVYESLSDKAISRLLDITTRKGVLEAVLNRPDLAFDWHARALRHLLTFSSLAKLIKGS